MQKRIHLDLTSDKKSKSAGKEKDPIKLIKQSAPHQMDTDLPCKQQQDEKKEEPCGTCLRVQVSRLDSAAHRHPSQFRANQER